MRIIRFPSLTEPQFFACVSAFVDSLEGELNTAAMALRRLDGLGKGGAFIHEMTLDTHRYGAMIVLDRWDTFTGTFGPHLKLSKRQLIIDLAKQRIHGAEEILERTNRVIDAAEQYSRELVEACMLAFQSVKATFEEEMDSAAESAKLGPMLPEEYREARQIFLQDLAAR